MNVLNLSGLTDILRSRREIKIDTRSPGAAEQIAQTFLHMLKIAAYVEHRPVVVVCIGTDRSTGDSLGPLVGTRLVSGGVKSPVYGTLDEPVHAANLKEVIDEINKKHRQPFIIAVDACLGNSCHIGYANLGIGPLRPGAGVKKDLPPVGDVYITGTVNIGGFMEYMVLQNTRLSLVMKMAGVIGSGLENVLQAFTL